jgi:hypothetical protein
MPLCIGVGILAVVLETAMKEKSKLVVLLYLVSEKII